MVPTAKSDAVVACAPAGKAAFKKFFILILPRYGEVSWSCGLEISLAPDDVSMPIV
jgi:hypothetical protein